MAAVPDEPTTGAAGAGGADDLWAGLWDLSDDEELVPAAAPPKREIAPPKREAAPRKREAEPRAWEAEKPAARAPDKRRKLRRADDEDEDADGLDAARAAYVQQRSDIMGREEARIGRQRAQDAADRARGQRPEQSQAQNGVGDFIDDAGVDAADADYVGYEGLSTDSEDEAGDRGQVRAALDEAHKTGFDEALIRLKPIRNKTKFSDQEMGAFCQDLVIRMETAHDEDKEHFLRGEIFLQKGKLCPDAQRCCANQRFREPFILAGGLNCLSRWLAPFIEGGEAEDTASYDAHVLPTVSVRTCCYTCIEYLMPAISVESLKSSQLAQRIRYYVEHPRETKAHRLKCQGFIIRWLQLTVPTKIMVKTDTAEEFVTIPTIEFGKVAANRDARDEQLKKIADSNLRRHAMIPMKDHLGFKMQPKQPEGVLDEKKKVPLAQLKMQRAVADLVRKSNADRAGRSKLGGGHVSIEGRGIIVPTRGLPTVRDLVNH